MQVAKESNLVSITARRPWGSFEQFTKNTPSTVKIIDMNPNSRMSLQYHKKRSEFWRVISGDVIAVLGRKIFPLDEGAEIFIPVGEVHRLIGGRNGAKILEISFGEFDESDIVRLEDDYDR